MTIAGLKGKERCDRLAMSALASQWGRVLLLSAHPGRSRQDTDQIRSPDSGRQAGRGYPYLRSSIKYQMQGNTQVLRETVRDLFSLPGYLRLSFQTQPI